MGFRILQPVDHTAHPSGRACSTRAPRPAVLLQIQRIRRTNPSPRVQKPHLNFRKLIAKTSPLFVNAETNTAENSNFIKIHGWICCKDRTISKAILDNQTIKNLTQKIWPLRRAIEYHSPANGGYHVAEPVSANHFKQFFINLNSSHEDVDHLHRVPKVRACSSYNSRHCSLSD